LALLADGDVLAAEGRRTAAEQVYREAAALYPAAPILHLRLARLYLSWNRLQEGLEAAAAAERLGADPAHWMPLRAALHAARGEWPEALDYGRAALALQPTDSDTRHIVAQSYAALGRVAEARAEYQALLTARPADRLAHERLGALLFLSDPAAARPHLQAAGTPLAAALVSALESAEGDRTYRLTLAGRACLAHGEPALAVQALRRAVAHSPAYADAQALLGQALAAVGRRQEAVVHMEQALYLAPDSVLAHSLLGGYYLQAGDPATARFYLEPAYELGPDNPLLCIYLAQTYAGLGQYAAAEIWLAEATRLAPEDAAVWELAARHYLNWGETGRAQGLEAAQTLVEIAPASAVAHELLGWAYFLSGDVQWAQANLAQAVELDPTLASAHYRLGRVYAYQGRMAEARVALTRALDLNTDALLRAEIERALDALNAAGP